MEISLTIKLILSILGLAIYTLWSVRGHLSNFKPSIFFDRNKVFWIWVLIAQVTYIAVFQLIPALEHMVAIRVTGVVNALLQVDWTYPDEIVIPVAYLSGAWLLSLLVNKGIKPEDKIGKSKVQ